MSATITTAADSAALHALCADHIVRQLGSAIATRGAAHWALAGGATPRGLYQLLATVPWRQRIDWSRVHLWFGDERCVAADHPESNYRMVEQALITPLDLAPTQLHRIAGELSPPSAAAHYAAQLQQLLPRREDGRPQLDLALLGMGEDGHTASLFPASDVLDNQQDVAAAVWQPQQRMWRITLTYPLLNAARELLLLVTGSGKAAMVRRVVVDGDVELPVARLNPVAPVRWYLDAAAAAELPAELITTLNGRSP